MLRKARRSEFTLFPRHKQGADTAPLDPNFEGYALLTTDSEADIGSVRSSRAPTRKIPGPCEHRHIHFDVLGRSKRLVTQMYFAGESLNETDRIIQTAAANRSRLIVPFERPASTAQGPLVGSWDIALDEG